MRANNKTISIYTVHWRKREMVKRRKSRPRTDRQLDGWAFALNKVFFHVMKVGQHYVITLHYFVIQGRQKIYIVRADCLYRKGEKIRIEQGVINGFQL